MMKKMVLFVVMAVLMMVGCQKKQVTIAGKPMTEQYILVEMLSQLIEAKTDLQVVRKQGVGGGTSNLHPAILSGEVDIYPEYTGTGWLFVLKRELIRDPGELYAAVARDYENEFGLQWSGLYGFNDTYGIAVSKKVADKYGINSYSDLAKHNDKIRFGAEYDFYEREDGYPGLQKMYGFDFKNKVELDIGLKYQAIGANQVEAINVFSTDGRLKEANLVLLEDDKNFFPSYFAASLVRQETLELYPELLGVLELLSGKISNDEMTQMNYYVEIEKKSPQKVAKDFLEDKGLL